MLSKLMFTIRLGKLSVIVKSRLFNSDRIFLLSLEIFNYLTIINHSDNPITPQAILAPAFPVLRDSSLPPNPRSSSFLCNTQDLPITEYGPKSCTSRSVAS
jgi:hypothetical protein